MATTEMLALHESSGICPLNAKPIPSEAMPLTPNNVKGREAALVSPRAESAGPSAVEHGYSLGALETAGGGGQECEVSLTSCKDPVCEGVVWGWSREDGPAEVRGEAEERQRLPARPWGQSPALGLVNEQPSLQKNRLL